MNYKCSNNTINMPSLWGRDKKLEIQQSLLDLANAEHTIVYT